MSLAQHPRRLPGGDQPHRWGPPAPAPIVSALSYLLANRRPSTRPAASSEIEDDQVGDLPPSAAPRRSAPPQGRLCGRFPPNSERRWVASLAAVPAGALVSVACPQPCPKETTPPGKPALCASRASPDLGRRPSPRRTARPRRGRGASGKRRHPSPARPGVAAYGISPRSRCGLRGPLQPTPVLGTGRFRCHTANDLGSFVGHCFPFSWRFPPRAGVSPLSGPSTRPRQRQIRPPGPSGRSPTPQRRPRQHLGGPPQHAVVPDATATTRTWLAAHVPRSLAPQIRTMQRAHPLRRPSTRAVDQAFQLATRRYK